MVIAIVNNSKTKKRTIMSNSNKDYFFREHNSQSNIKLNSMASNIVNNTKLELERLCQIGRLFYREHNSQSNTK